MRILLIYYYITSSSEEDSFTYVQKIKFNEFISPKLGKGYFKNNTRKGPVNNCSSTPTP